MDGRYGLTEEISKAHRRRLLAEADRERIAAQALLARTSRWQRMLRPDIREVLEEFFARQRGIAGPPQVAERIPVSAS